MSEEGGHCVIYARIRRKPLKNINTKYKLVLYTFSFTLQVWEPETVVEECYWEKKQQNAAACETSY